MITPDSVVRVILTSTLLVFSTSCSDKDRAAVADTGCCQVTTGSCASPVTKTQCDDLKGQSFHAGGTCRMPAGQCGVLQE